MSLDASGGDEYFEQTEDVVPGWVIDRWRNDRGVPPRYQGAIAEWCADQNGGED